MRFLFVRSGFCPSRVSILPRDIRLPSDSTSRWTPLPSAGVSHCQARNGLSPSSCHPCRVHHEKTWIFLTSMFFALRKIMVFRLSNLRDSGEALAFRFLRSALAATFVLCAILSAAQVLKADSAVYRQIKPSQPNVVSFDSVLVSFYCWFILFINLNIIFSLFEKVACSFPNCSSRLSIFSLSFSTLCSF